MKKPKVLVAMSGGVDSSVAALLLKNKGYEVIGAFMKNWSDTKNKITGECQWKDDRKEAMKITSLLGIPLITLDFEKEYKKNVVDEMFKIYRKGLTPNPDIDCNNKVKFPLLWKAAKKLGAEYIATGHYARIKRGKKEELLRARDEKKDQTYFLYRLNSSDLKHSLFPIGNLEKDKVREIAEKNNFPNFNRKSTVGICFIGKVNLKEFLQKKIKPKRGKILDPIGKFIGWHDGLYYYTLGQRIGPRFGIEIEKGRGEQKRWYVAKKEVRKNIIVAAPDNHPLLYRKEITMKNSHWIGEKPGRSVKVLSRIRQAGELLPSLLKYSKGSYKITMKKEITGISEGQAVVLYQGTRVLGGGVISF